jgi:predicted RNA-binding Zn-ribbon protein involved in translation (DUF1610 family)
MSLYDEPLIRQISLSFCTLCGGTIHETLCQYGCPMDGNSEPGRIPGSVKIAVYTLKETIDP